MKKVLYYLPRVIVSLLTLELIVVLLDGIFTEFNWRNTLILLIPTLGVLAATILGWKYPKVGGIIFSILGLVVIVMTLITPQQFEWQPVVFLGAPIFLAGILFLAEGFGRPK